VGFMGRDRTQTTEPSARRSSHSSEPLTGTRQNALEREDLVLRVDEGAGEAGAAEEDRGHHAREAAVAVLDLGCLGVDWVDG
jgi:hypothetical protein